MAATAFSFDLLGDDIPQSPVVVSVPHAGRDYPLALRAALRVPIEALLALEDRFVDAPVLAMRRHETVLIQRPARAWIDLNRAEHERDPLIDDGTFRTASPHGSAKVRAGLGLIPRRVPGAGDIWQRRFDTDEVTARIACDHRPYHRTLDHVLRAARARFGCAILLDIHSMPPLGPREPRIVLGDRFGRSAAGRYVHCLEDVARTAGYATGLNAPYAGGHILDRHARPAEGIHAVQVEIDRSLYLDEILAEPGPGLGATAAMLRAMVDALFDEVMSDEATAQPLAIAAE